MSAIEKSMRSSYEQIYESLIPKLGECDFSEASGRLGLSLTPDGAMTVIFLGRFECLAFLGGCLVRAMSITAKTGSIAGWEQDG